MAAQKVKIRINNFLKSHLGMKYKVYSHAYDIDLYVKLSFSCRCSSAFVDMAKVS